MNANIFFSTPEAQKASETYSNMLIDIKDVNETLDLCTELKSLNDLYSEIVCKYKPIDFTDNSVIEDIPACVEALDTWYLDNQKDRSSRRRIERLIAKKAETFSGVLSNIKEDAKKNGTQVHFGVALYEYASKVGFYMETLNVDTATKDMARELSDDKLFEKVMAMVEKALETKGSRAIRICHNTVDFQPVYNAYGEGTEEFKKAVCALYRGFLENPIWGMNTDSVQKYTNLIISASGLARIRRNNEFNAGMDRNNNKMSGFIFGYNELEKKVNFKVRKSDQVVTKVESTTDKKDSKTYVVFYNEQNKIIDKFYSVDGRIMGVVVDDKIKCFGNDEDLRKAISEYSIIINDDAVEWAATRKDTCPWQQVLDGIGATQVTLRMSVMDDKISATDSFLMRIAINSAVNTCVEINGTTYYNAWNNNGDERAAEIRLLDLNSPEECLDAISVLAGMDFGDEEEIQKYFKTTAVLAKVRSRMFINGSSGTLMNPTRRNSIGKMLNELEIGEIKDFFQSREIYTTDPNNNYALKQKHDVDLNDGQSFASIKFMVLVAYGFKLSTITHKELKKILADPTGKLAKKLVANGKIPSMIQARILQCGFKGTIIIMPFEDKDYNPFENAPDVLFSDSALKYNTGALDFRNMFVCVSSNTKPSGFVNTSNAMLANIPLNPPSDNEELDMTKEVADNISGKFAGIFDNDAEVNATSMLAMNNLLVKERQEGLTAKEEKTIQLTMSAAEANGVLAMDPYIHSQNVKAVHDHNFRIAGGKVPTSGVFRLITCDPLFLLYKFLDLKEYETLGGRKVELKLREGTSIEETKKRIEENVLKAGETFYGDKEDVEGEAAAIRNPITNYKQFMPVNMVKKGDAYCWWRRIIIFNSFDCLWIFMGGADFDGDEVMLIFDSGKNRKEDRLSGKIIEAVKIGRKDFKCFNFSEPEEADKEEITIENLKKNLEVSLVASNIGIINNIAVSHLEYLATIINFTNVARRYNDNIKVVSWEKWVELCRRTEGNNQLSFSYLVYNKKNEKGVLVPDIFYGIELKWEKDGTAVLRLKELEDEIRSEKRIIDKLEIYQSIEVDAVKTGVSAPMNEILKYQMKFKPVTLLVNQLFKGKLGDKTDNNVIRRVYGRALTTDPDADTIYYLPYSVLGWMVRYATNTLRYITALEKEFKPVNLTAALVDFLNEEEFEHYEKAVPVASVIRDHFRTNIGRITAERATSKKANSKNTVKDFVRKLGEVYDNTREELEDYIIHHPEMPINSLAAAMYAVTACKDDEARYVSSFLWMADDYLLDIFKRENGRVALKLDANGEIETMNGKKASMVKVEGIYDHSSDAEDYIDDDKDSYSAYAVLKIMDADKWDAILKTGIKKFGFTVQFNSRSQLALMVYGKDNTAYEVAVLSTDTGHSGLKKLGIENATKENANTIRALMVTDQLKLIGKDVRIKKILETKGQHSVEKVMFVAR